MHHEWDATDTEGHCMQCQICGGVISIYNVEEWNINIDDECVGELIDAERVVWLDATPS